MRDANSRREKDWEGDYWEEEEEDEDEEEISETVTIAEKAAEYDKIYSDETSIESKPDPYGAALKDAEVSSVEQKQGSDWVQDANGHWWKKNDEGYWWRLGEDGQWHSADESGYA